MNERRKVRTIHLGTIIYIERVGGKFGYTHTYRYTQKRAQSIMKACQSKNVVWMALDMLIAEETKP